MPNDVQLCLQRIATTRTGIVDDDYFGMKNLQYEPVNQ